MNPKAKKRKPRGTRVTLGGENKAAKFIGKNKPLSNGQSSKATRVNTRREEKAIKKGNVKEVTRTVQVSPASTKIVTKGKPSSSKTVTSTKVVPNEVRAGDFAGQKERPKGVAAPKADAKGNFGQQLQAAIQAGRAAGKETITFRGKKYAAGKKVTTSRVVTTPATKDVVKKTPAVTRTETKSVPQFKPFVSRSQRKKDKGKNQSTRRTTNARTQRVTVTGEKRK